VHDLAVPKKSRIRMKSKIMKRIKSKRRICDLKKHGNKRRWSIGAFAIELGMNEGRGTVA
jgi:hypothetical protein